MGMMLQQEPSAWFGSYGLHMTQMDNLRKHYLIIWITDAINFYSTVGYLWLFITAPNDLLKKQSNQYNHLFLINFQSFIQHNPHAYPQLLWTMHLKTIKKYGKWLQSDCFMVMKWWDIAVSTILHHKYACCLHFIQIRLTTCFSSFFHILYSTTHTLIHSFCGQCA